MRAQVVRVDAGRRFESDKSNSASAVVRGYLSRRVCCRCSGSYVVSVVWPHGVEESGKTVKVTTPFCASNSLSALTFFFYESATICKKHSVFVLGD